MRRVLLLAASILAVRPVDAAAEWLVLRTEHHQVAGNVSARELRDIGLRLEQFRDVIQTLNQARVRAIADTPVVVLAFPDNRSYRPFLLMRNGREVQNDGLFMSGLPGAFITVNLSAAAGGYRSVYHEFSHFLLSGAFGAAPTWFNEGLAEYYSTFEVSSDGRRALIGKLIPQHVQLLREQRLPLAKLLSITSASREYTDDTPDRHVLYAQSWALIHHALHGTPQRRDAVVALASRLAAGAKPEQAVLETYGITLPELERDLQTYIRREAYSATSVEFKNAVATALPADATQADQLDVEAWLGGVQASIGRDAQALVRLEKVLTARPAHGGAHAAMASILMRQGRSSEAQTHFQAAAKANAIPRSAFQVRITGRETRPAAAPETPSPAGSANETAPAGTAAPVPTPPRNGGLILNLRNVAPGEQRTLGTLQAIECRRDGVVVVVRTPQGATRASAASMAAINFVTFRSQAAGSINCGAQPEAPALLTSRTEGERRIAVALELLPDGYVP